MLQQSLSSGFRLHPSSASVLPLAPMGRGAHGNSTPEEVFRALQKLSGAAMDKIAENFGDVDEVCMIRAS